GRPAARPRGTRGLRGERGWPWRTCSWTWRPASGPRARQRPGIQSTLWRPPILAPPPATEGGRPGPIPPQSAPPPLLVATLGRRRRRRQDERPRERPRRTLPTHQPPS